MDVEVAAGNVEYREIVFAEVYVADACGDVWNVGVDRVEKENGATDSQIGERLLPDGIWDRGTIVCMECVNVARGACE